MKSKRTYYAPVVVFLLILLLAGCGRATQTAEEQGRIRSDTIRIGGNWELSGATAAFGTSGHQGVELAIKQKNDAGGINGKPVEYVYYDNKSTAEESVAVATRLTSRDQVTAIIGPGASGLMKAQIPEVANSQTPLVSSMNVSDGLTKDKQGKTYSNVFRICFTESAMGKAIAEFCNQKNYRTAAVVKDNSTDYGQNLSKKFKENFNGKVLAEESYVSGDTDFSALVTTIRTVNPEVIFIPGYYQEVGPLVKQLREAGVTSPIVCGDGVGNSEIVDLAGAKNLYNFYYTVDFVNNADSSQQVKDFVSSYEEAYGVEPDMYAALSYDAANLVMDAVQRAGSLDYQSVNKALAETRDFQGVCYDYTFDEHHNVIAPVYIVEVKNGKILPDKTVRIAPDQVQD